MQTGPAMRKLSVRLSVRQTRELGQNRRKKDLSIFLYHTKDHLSQFSKKKNGWWGNPFYLKFVPFDTSMTVGKQIFYYK